MVQPAMSFSVFSPGINAGDPIQYRLDGQWVNGRISWIAGDAAGVQIQTANGVRDFEVELSTTDLIAPPF